MSFYGEVRYTEQSFSTKFSISSRHDMDKIFALLDISEVSPLAVSVKKTADVELNVFFVVTRNDA